MERFNNEQVYDNVYMVFIDASGHSNIVQRNPQNIASQAFDLLQSTILTRLNRVVNKERCEIANMWSWLGDGGLFAIYDTEEQIALRTTMSFVKDILKLDLVSLQSEFKSDKISGELHLRIAVHKGTIKFTEEGQTGSIHSADINWGAHIEKAVPADSIAISKDIYNILSLEDQTEFVDVGCFEEKNIYIFTPNSEPKHIRFSWKSTHGFDGMETIQCYLERISQKDKSELIMLSQEKVIDFGTTLNTCSNYLCSTERPIPYRDAVVDLLKRGGTFSCYMLAPDSNGANQLEECRKENTTKKILTSMSRFKNFAENNDTIKKNFNVYQFNDNPNIAAMFFDPDSDNALCLYSPYVNSISGIGRADMPHYLVSKKHHKIYNYIWEIVNAYMQNAKKVI